MLTPIITSAIQEDSGRTPRLPPSFRSLSPAPQLSRASGSPPPNTTAHSPALRPPQLSADHSAEASLTSLGHGAPRVALRNPQPPGDAYLSLHDPSGDGRLPVVARPELEGGRARADVGNDQVGRRAGQFWRQKRVERKRLKFCHS